VEVGQMVSPQAPAFTIVKTDVIYARVAVPESEIGRIVMDKSADVSVSAFEGRTFTGRVSMIGAVADGRTRTYAVKIELSNPGGLLRPGMIVQAGIRTDKTVDMLTVPGSAIVRDADNLTYVFVTDVKRTAAVRKRVTPGDALRNEIEIRSGLDPEDTVIVSGQNKLSDGALIIITADPAPARSAKGDMG
jgi:RND family efflux transporter MFP subunit